MMILARLPLLLVVAAALVAAACGAAAGPQLKVLGAEKARRHSSPAMVLYVEVVNPVGRPLRLQKLQYTFAAGDENATRGEVRLERTVAADAAVVVEVPVRLDGIALAPGDTFTLQGKLFADVDSMQRTFSVATTGVAPGAP